MHRCTTSTKVTTTPADAEHVVCLTRIFCEQWSHLPHEFRRLVLVDEGAVLPDLALGAGLDLDGAHLDHGAREDLEEHLGRRVDHAEDVGLGGGVGDERGVGLEQAPPLEHAAVVAQVEGAEAAGVHLHDRRVVRQRLALEPQLRGVQRVQRRVRVVGPAAPREVVQALAEGVAVGDADRVSPINGSRACSTKRTTISEVSLWTSGVCMHNKGSSSMIDWNIDRGSSWQQRACLHQKRLPFNVTHAHTRNGSPSVAQTSLVLK